MSVTEEEKFVFMTYYSLTDDKFKEILIEAIDRLNNLENVIKVFDDQNSFNAACFVCLTAAYKSKKEIYECFDSKNCADLIKNFFEYFNTIQNEIIFENNVIFNNPHNLKNIEQKRASLFCMLQYAINIYMMNSINFCIKFSKNGGLNSSLKFLSDDIFLQKNLKINVQFLSRSSNVIEFNVLNITALSKACEEEKKVWIELDAINILLKTSKIDQSLKSDSYSGIINIADDKQLETLPEMKEVKISIIQRLEKIASDFENGVLDRKTRQMNLKGDTINCQVHSIKVENGSFTSLIFILKLLYKLSINEKMRNELYYENNLLKHLKSILLKANSFEAYFVLEIIAQLTFDKKIKTELINDSELNGLLEKFDKQNPNEIKNDEEKRVFKSVKIFIEQINWNLNNKIIKTEKTSANQTGHVMISYNAASRPLCLKIKENLEAFGLRVWIDVDDIHGSSLDAMAKAVEDASCVLMCVTEKYRQSVNCQAEAQYSFKLNKMIIPIIMQSDYEPQGWLGIIMGDKIYVSKTSRFYNYSIIYFSD
jgi:cell division FtsZ-interacting protein ZapD